MSRDRRARSVGLTRVFLHQMLVSLLVGVFLLAPLRDARANDVQISNFWLHPYSGGNGEVEFDVTWQNSWRSTYPVETYNWDAVWIFAKIRINGGNWTHLKLNMTGHTIPAGFTHTMGVVDTGAAHNASTNPAVGMFVYRSSDGFGTATVADMRLQWSYADNGASSGDTVEVQPIALEMVYIPEGAFYAGDNATSSRAFREKSTGDNDPWYISSENAITTTSGTSGNYYYPGPGDAENSVFTIPAAFPKGYGAFYMMKGEISQGQYVGFFNKLTDTQKSTRDITSASGKNSDSLTYRNNISWTGSGEATLNGGTHSGVAMNYMSWADLTALLDWSGLRPMSELEYEKACRGSRGVSSPIAAVSGEYAWGSTSITRGTSISNSGLSNERANSGSNANISGSPSLHGPVRVGSFAQGVNNRISAGAGFYGVLELSGNVYERAVTVGNSAGRVFKGRYHGDGVLEADGNPLVTDWPDSTTAAGAGFRGGGWIDVALFARLSGRIDAAYADTSRYYYFGGRGVRSAP